MSEVQAAMNRAQDKMLTMQARANAMQTIVEADDISGLLPASPLDREMQKLAAEQNIEDQLQAMKDELRLSGPTFDQKQIEGPTP
jgi:phage shock protein A